MILFTRGVSASVHAGIPHPPEPGTPLGADSPTAQSMVGDMVNARAVRILLECILVPSFFSSKVKRLKHTGQEENDVLNVV